MTDPLRKRALVLRQFTDGDTTYEAGSTLLIESGAFDNYHAAGLVAAPSEAAEEPATESAPAKPKRRK